MVIQGIKIEVGDLKIGSNNVYRLDLKLVVVKSCLNMNTNKIIDWLRNLIVLLQKKKL